MENVTMEKEEDVVAMENYKEGMLYFGIIKKLVDAANDVLIHTSEMPYSVLYRIEKNIEKMSGKANLISKTRTKILKKYVKLDAKGNFELADIPNDGLEGGMKKGYVYLKEEDKNTSVKEFEDFLKKEITDVNFSKIKMSELIELKLNPKSIKGFLLFNEFLVENDLGI